jgi:predicted DCC family thiol-disulfide oxidoreductase YuxK
MVGTSSIQPILLYDADCGFCRWSLAKVLAWDRRRRLRPIALQSEEAIDLLGGLAEEERMASWHLVLPDRTVRSAGAAAGPLLRLLPWGRPAAALMERFPAATERAYRWVADHRGTLGRAIPDSAMRRAGERIGRREASLSRKRRARR